MSEKAIPDICKIEDVTPLWRKRPMIINKVMLRSSTAMAHIDRISILKKVCAKIKNPVIAIEINPIQVKDVELHILKGELQGKIVTNIKNISQVGAEGTGDTFRWRACPVDESDYSWVPIPGSADIKGKINSIIKEQTKGIDLGGIEEDIEELKPNYSSTVTAKFSQSGIKESYIEALRTLFGKNTINIYRDGVAKINYVFNGQTEEVQKKIQITKPLPISGSVKIIVW